ncbi:MAG: glycosyl hydrolase family 18 protein [Bacilli bacterium]
MKKTILLFLLLIPFLLVGCSCDKKPEDKEFTFTFELYDEKALIVKETITYNEGDNLLEILKSKYNLVYSEGIQKINNLELSENNYFRITLNGEEKTDFSFMLKDEDLLKIEYLEDEIIEVNYNVSFREVDETEILALEVKENDKITAPTVANKDGYNFKGFYLDKEGVTLFDFASNVTSNLVIYLVYEEISQIETIDINVEFPTLSLRKMTPPENKTNGLIVLEPADAKIETYSLRVSDTTKLRSFIFTDPQDGLRKVHVECLDYGEAEVTITINGITKTYEFTLYPRKEEEVPFEEWAEMSFEEQEAMRLDRERREREAEVNEVARLKTWFEEHVPANATESFELINGTNVESVYIMWHSDHKGVIYPKVVDGVYTAQVTQITYDVVVNLTLTINSSLGSEELTKAITVSKGFDLRPLPQRPLIFAYVPTWGYEGIRQEDVAKIDVFNLCFAYVTNGMFTVSTIESLLPTIMPLREVGKRVVMSVQDGGKNGPPLIPGFSAAVSTAEGRTTIVNQMVQAVIEYDFDGIDLDWEGPGFSFSSNPSSPNDIQNFYLFVKELRAAMDDSPRKDLLLTAACAMSYPNNYSLDRLQNEFDYIHIMTYDGGSSTTTSHCSALLPGPGAAWSAQRGLNNFIATGFPRNKLTIGSAFYGKRYLNVSSTGDGLGVSVAQAASTMTYKNLRKEYWTNLSDQTYIYTSQETKTSWYYNKDTKVWIGFESPWAVAEKAKWAKAQGLGGIMFWEYNQDYNGELLAAMYNNFR